MQKIYTILTMFIFLASAVMAKDEVEKNGSIRGHVQSSDGKSAAYVTVSLMNTGKSTMTDEEGNFRLGGIKPGTYILHISHVGLATEEQQVVVTDGKQTGITITLHENAAQLNEVVVSTSHRHNRPVRVGKSGLRPLDIPQGIQVIDSTVIADQQINRLTDVIKNVNGIALGENRGSVNESFYARGYSLGANNVFKNGARTSLGGSLEASTLESVEVLKGSAALLYGGVTGGAVVNLVTKKPKFNWGGEVSMRAGSYDFYKPIVDVYGPISKNVAFRVIATKENANSYRDVVKTDRFYINPSLLFKISDKTDLLLQGDYLKSNYTPDFGIGTVFGGQIPDIGRSAFLNVPWAYNRTKTGTAQANLNHRFNDVWKLNVIAAYQSYNRDYFGAERPQGGTPTVLTSISQRSLTRSQTQEYTYNQQINLTGAAHTGSIKHTFLIGADADQSRSTSYAFKYGDAVTSATTLRLPDFDILSPATYATSPDVPYTRIYQNTFTPIYRMGAFVQDLIELTDKFKVLAGIRYTWQKQPRASTYNEDTGVTTLANNITSTTANLSLNKAKIDKAFSPKIGLIYQPLATTSVYASYANNFTVNAGTDVNLVPLAPSIIDQYEFGIKNDLLNGRLSVNVTGYRIINRRFTQTAQFLADGFTPNSDTNIKEFSGKTASDGVEVDVTGHLSSNWYFLAGYSYNFFRYTSTAPIITTVVRNPNGTTTTTTTAGITEGERVVGSVPHTANGTVFYTFTKGNVKGLKLGLSGFYTGARNSGFNTLKTGLSRGAPIQLSGYTTLDVSAGYTFKRKLSLLAKLSNITNELNYLVHENYSVNPIPPRMVSATLGYKF
jgi:iron complex outermembrane receptor protein